MAETRLAVVGLLGLVVVLAGCGAPIANSDDASQQPAAPGGTSDTTESTIDVTNGTLAISPAEVFARVQALHGTALPRPAELRVFNDLSGFQNQSAAGQAGNAPRFFDLAGLNTSSVNVSLDVLKQKNGYVTGLGSVVLFVGENATDTDQRILLAHELTHYIQVKQDRQRQLLETRGLGTSTTDDQFVVRALIEGGAIFTADSYLDSYTEANQTNAEWYTGWQTALPDGHIAKHGNAMYIFGHDYVTSRVESPANLSAIYKNPPQTSEQVLHGLTPATEPPANLTLAVETGENWVASGHNQLGEAFLRVALDATAESDRAVTASTGWGNDTLRYLRPSDGDGQTGYVWAIRWDDAANATAFASAYRDGLDARGVRHANSWHLPDEGASVTFHRPSEQTTVLTFGPTSLVETVTVTGADGAISVSTRAK